jgi:hypothetical protein
VKTIWHQREDRVQAQILVCFLAFVLWKSLEMWQQGTLLPQNTRAELCRHLARLRVVREQIRAIEQERLRKLAAAPAAEHGPSAMVRLIARVLGVGIENSGHARQRGPRPPLARSQSARPLRWPHRVAG